MSTELEAVNAAVAEFDKVGAGLGALQEQYGGVVFDVATTPGMKSARDARLAIREPRYEVQRVRKAAKAPILALGKKLDAEAERITIALEAIESPIDQQIKKEEKRVEDEKAARAAAELARVTKIHEAIAEIRNTPAALVGLKPKELEAHLAQLTAVTIDESFAEFAQQADDALTATIAKVQAMVEQAEAAEAEAEKVRQERAELARLRKEADERIRADREAEEARAAQAQREAAQRDAERQAEIDKRNAELDERERNLKAQEQQQELSKAAEVITQPPVAPFPELTPWPPEPKHATEVHEAQVVSERPTDEQIIMAVSNAFNVSPITAWDWVLEVRPADQAA